MSYILDALRKADAEREQGRVPGLHSQLGQPPLPAGTDEVAPPAAAPPAWPLMVVAGLVGAAMAAGALWWALAPASTETANMRAPDQATTQTVAQHPTPSSMQGQAQPLPAVRAATTPRVEPVPAPNLALPQAAPQAPRPAPAPAPTAAPTAPAQPVSAMPDAVRRSLPPLIFGGAMHSDNAASRMLVINNNVYREGDEPVPGLVLEQILLKSAVFRYQGQRFSVNY